MEGRWVGFWSLTIALGVLFFAGVAVAQDSQAQIEGEIVEAPDTLPGVYEAALTVGTQHPGVGSGAQVCACTETTIDLFLGEAPDWVVDASFDPASFTVDWVEESADGHLGGHVQDVALRFTVDEEKLGDEPHSLIVDGEGSSDTPFHDVHVAPTQLNVHFPGGEDARDSDEDVSMTEASEEESSDVPFLGGIASVVTAALVGMVARGTRA